MSDSAFAPLNDPEVTAADFVDLLSNRCRRDVLSYLQRTDDDVVELAELVERVQRRDVDRATDEDDAIRIALHHVHLPELADGGLIDYETERKTVRYDRHPGRERKVSLVAELTEDVP